MTHLRVTKYVEVHLGQSLIQLNPGVYEYLHIKDMIGEEFMQDKLADGTLVPVNQEGTE